jgi:hypothetical protein
MHPQPHNAKRDDPCACVVEQGCDEEWARGVDERFGHDVDANERDPALPSVASHIWFPAQRQALEQLGCTRNDMKQHCVAYEQTLPEMLLGVPELRRGRRSAEERCLWWRDVGCCAPLLVEVAYGATTAHYGGALNNRSVSDNVLSMIRFINHKEQCRQLFEAKPAAGKVNRTACVAPPRTDSSSEFPWIQVMYFGAALLVFILSVCILSGCLVEFRRRQTARLNEVRPLYSVSAPDDFDERRNIFEMTMQNRQHPRPPL